MVDMSRHYNTTHPERSRTDETKGYRKRLQSRGLSKAPCMADVADLRNKQERRIRETCTITHEHDTDHCDGMPFPYADAIGGSTLTKCSGSALLTGCDDAEHHFV